jgi:uncharacterized protein
MKLAKELFVIPDLGNFILYAPFAHSVIEAGPGLSLLKKIQYGNYNGEQPELVERLKKAGILVDEEEENCQCECEGSGEFRPTGVTLFPTSDCNLRCTYCYGSAGESHNFMDFETARAAIDFVFANAQAEKERNPRQNEVHVGFHGGGEPFFHWRLIKQVVEYSKQKAEEAGLNLGMSSATNGMLGKQKLEFIVANLSSVNISFDGTEDIQNRQRPCANGMPSYGKVLRTVRYFEERKFRYGIRSTITSGNVERMKEMLDLFTSISSLKSFHFEPVFECGRCRTTGQQEPNPELFLKRIIEAKEYAKTKGVEIYYSGGRCGSPVQTFCGAMGRNFCVTPTGSITSCYEVSLPNDPRGDIFYYGKVEKGVKIDEEKRVRLLGRTVERMPHCKDCFAKFSCAGDCPAKVYAKTHNIFDPSENTRCTVNRGVLLYELRELLKEGKQNEPKTQFQA